ncbi:hypothetical protein [Nocardioides sambongensis]|uniref:hypothetical protein n=1 Tax=Nocardioides sambongensis TaxID=2589074 RepID=UPI001E519AD9|nr:hypothetical protein [Nocardioides sambongensis]
MPNARTLTTATSRVSTGGWVDACTISQPAVAVSATPQTEASPPSTVAPHRPRRGSVLSGSSGSCAVRARSGAATGTGAAAPAAPAGRGACGLSSRTWSARSTSSGR